MSKLTAEELLIRDARVNELLTTISLIRDVFKDAHFPLTMLSYRLTKLENADQKELNQAKHFLNDYMIFVRKYWAVKSLVAKEVWDHYRLLNIEGLYETIEMANICLVLKVQWKRRPAILRSGDVGKSGEVRTNSNDASSNDQ